MGSSPMIEINLARQLQCHLNHHESSWSVCGLVTVVVFMGFVVSSWWWTASLQEQVDALLQEKVVKMQALVRMKERLENLERYNEQKSLLINSIERIKVQDKEKAGPVTLLDGLSRNVGELDIWLERMQLESRMVELQGQSLSLEDIGKFMEALENDRIIRSLPVVEIFDRPEGGSNDFSFLIRFIWDHR